MAELIKKNFDFAVKSTDESNDFYRFSGYASTFGNVDLEGDIIKDGAFNTLSKMPRLLYQHDFKQPIGVIESIKQDSKGLFIEAKLPKQNRLSNDVGALLKCGALDSMSIGFIIEDFEMKGGNKIIKEIDLHEISVVTFPANPEAVITGVKSLNKTITYDDLSVIETKKELENILREVGFSKNAAKAVTNDFKIKAKNRSESEISSESKSIKELNEILNNLKRS